MDKITIKYKNVNILTQVYKVLRTTHIHNFLNVNLLYRSIFLSTRRLYAIPAKENQQ
jgi:hypothetical protein